MLTGKVILYALGLVSVKSDGLSYVSLNTCKTDERPVSLRNWGRGREEDGKREGEEESSPFSLSKPCVLLTHLVCFYTTIYFPNQISMDCNNTTPSDF